MKRFVILSRLDVRDLRDNKPVSLVISGKPYILCTDEYFEEIVVKKKSEVDPQESEG
jgi:hypothetical protein